jgi:hypothetical protein
MAERYNRELAGGSEDGVRILPARIGDTVYDGTFHTFDPLEFRHPMLALWKGNLKSGFQTVPVLKYYQLKLPDDSAANVVLGIGAGDPLIVEESIGRGRSVVVATDVSTTSVVDAESRRPWSLIASWLNSQPFLESLWKGAIGGKIDERNVLVGETFGALYEAVGDGRIFVETPWGKVDKIPPASQADAGRWSFSETDVSGFYKVRAGSEQADPQSFAVNLKTQESDLEKLHPEDLPPGFRVSGEFQDIESLQPVAAPSRELAMHSFLLYVVLALLFVEVFLAWWIGNRST